MSTKSSVHAQVPGQLGVEGRGERRTLADGDDPTRARLGRQNLDPGPTSSTQGARMNTARNGGPPRAASIVDIALEGVDLAAERVAPDRHVDRAERLLVAGPFQPAGRPA